MTDYVAELREAIAAAKPLLEALSDDESRHRPGAGKWSPREIVGHLIDSASNNHQRFVRARFQDAMVFPTYQQDAWVDAQGYREAPWLDLVSLWSSFNLHIARVMESTPASERARFRTTHNLDQIAWRTVPADQPASLDYFMADYVGHLKHHLRQILGSSTPR